MISNNLSAMTATIVWISEYMRLIETCDDEENSKLDKVLV